MTRDEVFADYAAIRAGVDRVTEASARAFSRAEGQRAAKLIAGMVWKAAYDSENAMLMISDLALHERGPNGRRAYDRFLAGPALRMGADDLDVARRMATSRFSIFLLAGRHEVAGVWVEDLMDEKRRLWLMGVSLEKDPSRDTILAMRVFDAGRFHVSMFCIYDFLPSEADVFEHGLLSNESSLVVAAYRIQIAGYLIKSL